MILPLVREIPWKAPEAAFAIFSEERGAILLESTRQMPTFGRYSFIAVDPFDWWEWSDHTTVDIWTFLETQLAQYPLATHPDLPPFQGGLAGAFSYELAHTLEALPRTREDHAQFPDAMIGAYDLVAAFDHHTQRAWIFSSGYPEKNATARLIHAEQRLAWLVRKIAYTPPLAPLPAAPLCLSDIQAKFSQTAYEDAIMTMIAYIRAGDIFEANMTQRWVASWPSEALPFDLYRRLRHCNPAPFAAFIQGSDSTIVSGSPERFIRLQDRNLETTPIKGTRPRGATPAADKALSEALASSEKDRAENVMIVDLMRNDLSRICLPHSVQVPKLCHVESFETVHHLVSTVTGTLTPDSTPIDVLRATFPGGSITGAPKIRAMEIITEIEGTARGPYCGVLGYIGFDGTMDTSIVIRSFSIRQGVVTYQAGGAIVYDSVPAEEYQEILDKARALTRALTGEL